MNVPRLRNARLVAPSSSRLAMGGQGFRISFVFVVATVCWFAGSCGRREGCGMFDVSDEGITVMRLKGLANAAVGYYAQTGRCSDVDQLIAANELDSLGRVDPWKTPYRIICSPDKIEAISAGGDRRFGTDDDLRYSSSLSDLTDLDSALQRAVEGGPAKYR
jgi:hypothetical protein